MSKYKEKYFRRRRKELSEHIDNELDTARDKSKEFENKLEKRPLSGRGELGRGWSYLIKEKDDLIERIKYMENLRKKII